MIKRALLVIGFLAGCFPLVAQQTSRPERSEDETVTFEQLSLYRPEIFTSIDSSVLVRDLPMLTFLDGRLPGSTALGRMGRAPVANLPVALVSAAPAQKTNASPASGKDSPGDVISPLANQYYYGGEMGFLYGRSTGKFGGDDFESYIVGTVGNDKFQITVGASHGESNGRIPRWAR